MAAHTYAGAFEHWVNGLETAVRAVDEAIHQPVFHRLADAGLGAARLTQRSAP
jgi:hypothetical protein